MFTLLYNPYLVNWFTRREGGVKTGQNLVHVVCEQPLGSILTKSSGPNRVHNLAAFFPPISHLILHGTRVKCVCEQERLKEYYYGLQFSKDFKQTLQAGIN